MAQNKVKFTHKRLHDFACNPDKSQEFIWDSDTTGLGLRCTKAGAKTYIFQAKLDGKSLRMKIGPLTGWSIPDAQKEARRLRQLIDKGIDPREAKREKIEAGEQKKAEREKQAARDSLTVKDAWDTYIYSNKASWGERHLKDHINLAQEGGEPKKRGKGLTKPGVLAPLLKMNIKDITPSALISWVKNEAPERENNTRQGYAMFRTFWRWCSEEEQYKGIIDASIVENKTVKRAVPGKRAKSDSLERSQLKPWFNAVNLINNPPQRVYLQALLLTGARREEMANLRWEDVDLQWNSLWVKDKVEGSNKAAGEGRMIPLTPHLKNLLLSLPRHNQWVFYSTSAKNGRLTEARTAHNKALEVAGVPHVTLHGLRRSFSNLSEWVELPSGIVAQIMGHKPSATVERHYKKRPLELLAAWHTKLEKWILEQTDIAFDYDDIQQGLKVVS